jgi:tetratricopeptide (TPR) repeat protein
MPAELDRAKSIFLNALGHSAGDERGAFLVEACGADEDLRREVDELLAHNEQADGFLDSMAPTVTAALPAADLAGTVLAGRYRLLEPVGEGGMGAVWVAQQTEPVKRLVAVKLIKPGMDSKAVLARFEAERQALALMDHPNIAKVLDGGLAPDGRPFFVMELVKGVPITEHCDAHRLTPRQRLELFIPVCQAIQHAHQKGIIHRDVKPSNVLIALYDDKPVPKVIDFGVAKAAGQPLAKQTVHTHFGAVVGTLEYMSPEQATFNNLDVDTRSDVYSLGVLLYELLAGSPPFTRKELESAGVLEMLRVIREREPARPSTRLSTADGLPSLAANRGTEPARLTRLVRGELDWIVMRALEKDRSRRYETANGLAADVQRYLADEPVQACPPSAGYRLRKFVRRNKGPVVAVSLVVGAVLAGTAGLAWGLVGEARAKREALDRQHDAEQAAEGQRLANEAAQKRLAQIERANRTLQYVFDGLDPANQDERPLRVILAEGLDAAARTLDEESVGDPLTVARTRAALGNALRSLGFPEKAIDQCARAGETLAAVLGEDDLQTLINLSNLGLAYHDAGRLDLALLLDERLLGKFRAILGPDDTHTLRAMNQLAVSYEHAGRLDLALPLLEEALHRATVAKADIRVVMSSMSNLAAAYHDAGRSKEAMELLDKAFALSKSEKGPSHPWTLTAMNNLAQGYLQVGKLDLAVQLNADTLQLRRTTLGPDHPETLISMQNLATAHREAGRPDLAVPLAEDAVRRSKEAMGPENPRTIQQMDGLAECYRAVGRFDEAISVADKVAALWKKIRGPDHPDTLVGTNSLGAAYWSAGQPEKAIPVFEDTLARRKKLRGPDHPETLETMNNLAAAYMDADKPDLAVPLLEETVDRQSKVLGPDNMHTAGTRHNLGHAYLQAGKTDLALRAFEHALAGRRASLGVDHPDTLVTLKDFASACLAAGDTTRALPLAQEAVDRQEKRKEAVRTLPLFIDVLAQCYEQQKEFDRAEPWRWKEADLVKKNIGSETLGYGLALAWLGGNLLAQSKFDKAEPVLREALSIREKIEADEWSTFNTKSQLGGALLGQKKFADAEPLLLAGYKGMKAREQVIPRASRFRLTDGLERLVQLYDALGNKDRADKWRNNLAEAKAAEPAETKKD